MPIILPTSEPTELQAAITQAVALLKAGLPVALPTETVYGLAADALNPDALLRIFQTKERPLFDPLIVHLPDRSWLNELAAIPAEDAGLVSALVDAFWPGPLTLVLPRTSKVPDLVTSGLSTVALRLSSHPVFDAIVKAFGSPLAAPSANRFGRISPTTAEHVRKELDGRIPLIVDGGATQYGLETTVVLVQQGALSILRAGPVTAEQLGEFAPLVPYIAADSPVAPGQLKSHYAPVTPLTLLDQTEPESAATAKTGLLAWKSAPVGHGFQHVEILSERGDLGEAAATLFAKLRKLDESGVDAIYAESVPEAGLGIAIMDRLRKAATRG